VLDTQPQFLGCPDSRYPWHLQWLCHWSMVHEQRTTFLDWTSINTVEKCHSWSPAIVSVKTLIQDRTSLHALLFSLTCGCHYSRAHTCHNTTSWSAPRLSEQTPDGFRYGRSWGVVQTAGVKALRSLRPRELRAWTLNVKLVHGRRRTAVEWRLAITLAPSVNRSGSSNDVL